MSENLNESSKESASCGDCHSCEKSGARRKFLQTAAVAAGGLVLGLQAATRAAEPGANAAGSTPGAASTPPAGETQFALPPSVLENVGAFEVVQAEDDQIIIARTGPASIVACSAVCTHKGCVVDYIHDSRQFVCPCHGARYELSGKVVKGPAKRDLKAYQVRAVLGLSPTESTKATQQ